MDKEIKRIATYGTLKRGGRWYKVYEEGMKFVQEDIVKGKMYSMGYKKKYDYPVLINGDKEIEVEVFDVNEMTFRGIQYMEEQSGYETKMVTLKSGEEVYMWLQNREQVKGLEEIEKFEINGN